MVEIELRSLCMLGRQLHSRPHSSHPTCVDFKLVSVSSQLLIDCFPRILHCMGLKSFTLVWILTSPLTLDALGRVSASFDLLLQIEVYGSLSRACREGLPELSAPARPESCRGFQELLAVLLWDLSCLSFVCVNVSQLKRIAFQGMTNQTRMCGGVSGRPCLDFQSRNRLFFFSFIIKVTVIVVLLLFVCFVFRRHGSCYVSLDGPKSLDYLLCLWLPSCWDCGHVPSCLAP